PAKARITLAMSVLLAAAVSGCGGAGSKTTSSQTAAAKRPSPEPIAGPEPLRARALAVLPAPVQDPATVAIGDRVLLMGGLNRADVSVPDVVSLTTGETTVQRGVPLPVAVHDAAAAWLRGTAVLIGGGEPSHSGIVSVNA